MKINSITLFLPIFLCASLSFAAELQQTAEEEALDSIDKIVSKYNDFFSKPQKMISRYQCDGGCNGDYIITLLHVVRDISYDVKKTDSLISPYIALVSLKSKTSLNTRCGSRNISGHIIGSATELEALSFSENTSCFAPPYANDDNIVVSYAYQKGKWQLKSATRFGPSGPSPQHNFLAVVGIPSGELKPVLDDASREFNRKWVETLIP